MLNESNQKEADSAAVHVTVARNLIALLSPLVKDEAERSSTLSEDVLPHQQLQRHPICSPDTSPCSDPPKPQVCNIP